MHVGMCVYLESGGMVCVGVYKRERKKEGGKRGSIN